MASNSENHGNLTNYQYMRLGQVISCSSMESIALGYMDIDHEKIKNLKAARRDDMEGFVRDLIREWARRHPDDQIQNLAHLFKAAKDAGYVNPREIECILGVSINECGQQTRNTDAQVTLDELETIADKIRPYTADAMKIEVAPWIRDYVVDMEELYTELALEKVHNKPIGEDAQVLNHYSELFKNCKSVEKPLESNTGVSEIPAKRCRTDNTTGFPADLSPDKCGKILMKGDPGMGKTTQCKKISWDWAKKSFKHVDIVFFVSLKFVKPGDLIENIIIKQNPFIKGLNINEKKLGSILQSLGKNCLLILDGLDEHALGANQDVLSIVKGEKHLKCNIIVTSRPHSTRQIEKYFPTVVRVEGFTQNKAKEFASKILKDKKGIETVLNFNPSNAKGRKDDLTHEEKYVPIHKCPILLSFLCLLANEDNNDLFNTKMHTGEIYTRMVRCLYKTYIIRKASKDNKEMDFGAARFAADVTSVGRLALQTLLSGDPLLKRADVIREIGEDAFDYGLLIGCEDFRLFRDETADILVTFPHRSIQEFLGALYFIWMLDKGEEIQSLLSISCKKPIFLTNTLFLQFCLWLLCDDQKYFTLKDRQKVFQRMVHYCVDLLNKEELDMNIIADTYPALDISSKSSFIKDKPRVRFLCDILLKCNRTSSLVLAEYHAFNQFLGFIEPNLKSVTFIQHGYVKYRVNCFKSTEIVIQAENSTLDKLSVILKYYNKVMNNPVVRLYLLYPSSHVNSAKKSCFLNVKTLYLSHIPRRCNTVNEWITVSPDLKELYIRSASEVTMKQVINKLSCGDCQNLSYLSFDHCDVAIQGKISALFESARPNLKYLNLIGTRLLETDLQFLCLACNGPEKKLPNLTSLCITVPSNMSTDAKLFLFPWLTLKKLYVYHEATPDSIVSRAIRDSKLPNLTCLRIVNSTIGTKIQQTKETLCLDQLVNLQSVCLDNCICGEFQIVHNLLLSQLSICCSDALMGFLSPTIVPGFLKLTSLTLKKFRSQDLSCLAQAKVKGRLPALRKLDISYSNFWSNKLSLPEFMCLFDESCTWFELSSLDIRETYQHGLTDQVIDCMNEIVSRDYLSSLQKLGINRFESRNVRWNNLEKIFLCESKESTLRNIADTKEKFLPALQTLCIEDFRGHNAEIVRILSELGVSCHRTCKPRGNEFSKAKCHCEL